ncbi:hypothetical protein M413DRAFT_443953 [Hebeloma cylindrosporum]|uniref:Uncharacterized protein n=1 Tax=Hebeloma cylindrosporum TaxID=76867 RepID=A0A0C3CG69_HEBCY|nr:hypothetical protein M413DRAFT_443953 [Hebeloma cylindrosporum h7]
MPNESTKKNLPANVPPKLRVVAHNARIEQALEREISGQRASVLKTNPKLNPSQAMWTVQEQILANNPWEPLKNGKCPINDLPNEILAYIFSIGVKEEEEGDDSEYEDEAEGEEDDEWEDMDTDDEFDDGGEGGSSPPSGGSPIELSDTDDSDSDSDLDDEDDDDDEEPGVPFQVLVSHVCKRWREVALDSHILWTTLDFAKRPRLERARMYMARSGGLPLNIRINCTFPENVDEEDHPDHPLYNENKALRKKAIHDALVAERGEDYSDSMDVSDDEEEDDNDRFLSQQELAQILDLIEPKVSHWGTFEFHASTYGYIHLLISRLHALPSAPMLESFEVYHIEDCDDYEVFNGDDKTSFLPFHGDAPLLKEAIFWGVHIDWDAALPSFLRGLHVFELSFHTKDVRPSYKTFTQIINNSPDLHTLSLSLSGPALGNDVPYDTDIEEGGWGATPLTILSLRELALQFHDLKYALALVKHLDIPNVTSLLLNFDEEDYSEFVDALLKPVKGRTENILAHIEHVKISGLPCNVYSAEALLGQLGKLKSLNIKVRGWEESIIFQKLSDPYSGRPSTTINVANAEPPQQQEQQDPTATVPQATGLGSAPSSSPTSPLPTSNAPLPTVFCPRLESIVTCHVTGMQLKHLLLARRKLGVPLKRVSMSQEDPLSVKEERWIRANVEEFDFFEPSDSEDEEELITDDDENGEDGDEGDGGDDDNDEEEDDDDDEDEDEDEGDENQTPQTALFSPLARHLGRGRRGRHRRSMDLD